MSAPFPIRAVLLAYCLCASQARAISLGDQVEVHGYGSQDYLQTSANTYLDANDHGSWNSNFLGLVGAVQLSERSKLWAQLEASNQDVTRFTWFFVDYEVSNSLTFHAGRVKYPLGLYNETIDTKFLQLSSIEPGIYQAGADFVHDAYTGVGLDYSHALGKGGSLVLQVFGGAPYDPENDPNLSDRSLIGTRADWHTPVPDLRLLLSYVHGDVEVRSTHRLVPEERTILSADYTPGGWDVKAEYATHHFEGVDANGWYVQAGYTFDGRWTPFARYDQLHLDRSDTSSDSLSQTSVVAGLGYSLLANCKLRVEAHFNRGYALPVATGEVAAGAGTRNWTLYAAGVHFVF